MLQRENCIKKSSITVAKTGLCETVGEQVDEVESVTEAMEIIPEKDDTDIEPEVTDETTMVSDVKGKNNLKNKHFIISILKLHQIIDLVDR